MRTKVEKLKISKQSSLVLDCDCVLEDVEIDGHVEITDKDGKVSLKNDNKNYKQVVATDGNEEPHLLIRKFKIAK